MLSNKKKWFLLLACVVAVSLVLSACQCQPEVVEKEVLVTVETEGEPVEVIVTVTPMAEAEPTTPPVGVVRDVYRLAILSDLTTFNVWALFDDADSSYWNYAVINSYYPALYGLSDVRFDIIPSVAADFPSPITEEGDFWVATVPLKAGLKWSDGSDLTAEDVAFTANTSLAFQLGLNWNSAYNPDYLDYVEAVDATTAKFVFSQSPGLAIWQYGAMQGPIVSKAFWEPKIGDALAAIEGLDSMDPESEDYLVKLAEGVEILHGLDPAGEPAFGEYKYSKWETGAFAENVVNEEFPWGGTMVEEFANGAYRESREDEGYEFVAYGDATGEKTLELTEGPYFNSTLYNLYDQDASILALKEDEVDFLLTPLGLGKGLLAQLEEDPGVTIVTNPANGFRYLAFNHAVPQLQDAALRQAVDCMIDRQFLTDSLLQGAAIPVYTPVPTALTYWSNPDVPKYCDGFSAQERMEWATAHLKDAGYSWDVEPSWNEDRGGSVDIGEGLKTPDGAYFPDMTLLAPAAGYDPLRATAGVHVGQWMKQLGIPIDVELTNFNNILTAVYDTGEYDMFILGWGLGVFPDYVCDFFYTGNPYNYSDADYDAMCDEFYAATDMEKARELNFKLQETAASTGPYIYLFTTPMYDAYRGDNIQFPYTEVLDGIGPGLYGMQDNVMPAHQ
jgi:ABC-type transport system substrate-binding protein